MEHDTATVHRTTPNRPWLKLDYTHDCWFHEFLKWNIFKTMTNEVHYDRTKLQSALSHGRQVWTEVALAALETTAIFTLQGLAKGCLFRLAEKTWRTIIKTATARQNCHLPTNGKMFFRNTSAFSHLRDSLDCHSCTQCKRRNADVALSAVPAGGTVRTTWLGRSDRLESTDSTGKCVLCIEYGDYWCGIVSLCILVDKMLL